MTAQWNEGDDALHAVLLRSFWWREGKSWSSGIGRHFADAYLSQQSVCFRFDKISILHAQGLFSADGGGTTGETTARAMTMSRRSSLGT